MSAYVSTALDILITDKPCILHSVTLTPSAAAVGDATLYDGQGAETGYEIITLRTASGTTCQVRFNGLELSRGLYVDVGSNVTRLTVEWEPVGYQKERQTTVVYTTQVAS